MFWTIVAALIVVFVILPLFGGLIIAAFSTAWRFVKDNW